MINKTIQTAHTRNIDPSVTFHIFVLNIWFDAALNHHWAISLHICSR